MRTAAGHQGPRPQPKSSSPSATIDGRPPSSNARIGAHLAWLTVFYQIASLTRDATDIAEIGRTCLLASVGFQSVGMAYNLVVLAVSPYDIVNASCKGVADENLALIRAAHAWGSGFGHCYSFSLYADGYPMWCVRVATKTTGTGVGASAEATKSTGR